MAAKKQKKKPSDKKRTKPLLGAELRKWSQWSKLYWGFFALIAIVTLALSFRAGINADDFFQNDYSEKLVDYYLTSGQDTSALYIESGSMHLYGGLFETVAGFGNRALGNEVKDPAYHHFRHVLIAICTLLIIFFVSQWARRLGGWPAAFIAILLLFFAPRFMGHGIMNPKDIPFALGFAIHLYYLSVLLDTMPKPKWSTVIGSSIGLIVAIGLRPAGILLIFYLGLFFLLHWRQNQTKELKLASLLPYVKYGAIITIAGYFLALITWPYALQSPLTNVLEAFNLQANIAVRIRLLFGGKIWFSDVTPWYYPLFGILRTVPIHTLLGLLLFTVSIAYLRKRLKGLQLVLPVFAFLFPLIYISIQNPNLYSGWRHILFVIPSLIVLASLGWVAIIEQFWGKAPKKFGYPAWGIFAVLLLIPGFFMASNGALMYTYFNKLNLSSPLGKYEIDYWGLSTRDAVDWMREEGIIPPNPNDTIIIAGNFEYGLKSWLGRDLGPNVKSRYVRYRERRQSDWDYGIFINHFINGRHLREGYFPPENAIKTFYVDDIPVAAVVKRSDNRYTYQASKAMKARNLVLADSLYRLAVQVDSKNEEAWIGMAQNLLNTRQFPAAEQAAREGIAIDRENVNYLQILGLAQLNQNNLNGAEGTFRQCLEIYPDLASANYYLGQIAYNRKDYAKAVEALEKAIDAQPTLAQAYLLISRVYADMGDNNAAQQYQNYYNQLTGKK